MKNPIFVIIAAGFAALLCVTVYGQMPPPLSGTMRVGVDGKFSASATIDATRIVAMTVRGAPYSGEEIAEQTQVLADGTRVARSQPSVHVWRDFAGRMRTERPLFSGLPGQISAAKMPYLIEISDPGASMQYYIDPVSRVVHRCKIATSTVLHAPVQPMATGTPIPINSVAAPGTAAPQISSESLGTQVIQGIMAQGMRTTMTYAAGAMGNDRPIVTTTDMWRSPELNIVLFTKSVDPRSGEHTRALINISRAEPDPALFQIPSDYAVKDEEGSFTITVNGTN